MHTRTQVVYADGMAAVSTRSASTTGLRPKSVPTPPAGARAPWGSMSRERVVNSATELIAADGYEQLTIRGLAASLGVAPMSIYRHVRDKDDLLDEVVDRLLATAWQPRASEGSWREWISEAADNLRAFLVSQPAALHVYLRHPVVSGAAVVRMEAMLRVLREATTDDDAARGGYAAIHTYTLGFATLEAARAGWCPPDDQSDALTSQLAGYTTATQFALGLGYLLDGIAGAGAPKAPARSGSKSRPGRTGEARRHGVRDQ